MIFYLYIHIYQYIFNFGSFSPPYKEVNYTLMSFFRLIDNFINPRGEIRFNFNSESWQIKFDTEAFLTGLTGWHHHRPGVGTPVQVCVLRTFSVFLPSSLLLSPPSSSSYWPLLSTQAAVLSTGDIATATASTGDVTWTQTSDIITHLRWHDDETCTETEA